MSAKTKSTSPSKPVKDEAESNPSFSFEFLDMLSDTADDAFRKCLVELKVPKEVLQIHDAIILMHVEMEGILTGRPAEAGFIYDSIAQASEFVSKMGVQFQCPSGTVTLVKDRLALHQGDREC